MALRELLRQSGSRELPFFFLPKLIRFVEVNGEREWIELQPANLAISFGPGVELKRVVLQLTDEPVTPQPKIWPQWLVMELGPDSPLFRGAQLKGYGGE